MRQFVRLIVSITNSPSIFTTISFGFGIQPAIKPMVKPYSNDAIPVDFDSYFTLLHSCSNTKQLKQVHAHMLAAGLEQSVFLGTKLVNMYATRASLSDARLVFDKMLIRNVFLWNAVIRGHVRSGFSQEALALYYQMLREGFQPDNFTFPCVTNACADLIALEEGKEIHEFIIRCGFESDVFVASALVTMYAKCGRTLDACQVFDKMPQRDVVVFNAMIAACAQNGHSDEALNLFREMEIGDQRPDAVTIASVLPACAHLAALKEGKKIHNFAIKCGFESDVFVGSALIDMYAKCGCVWVARQVFDKMSQRNTVSWNAMIAGYTHNGYCDESLELFRQMQLAGIKLDSVTATCVLPACASLAALQSGREIHDYIIKSGFHTSVCVGNALIDVYAKCHAVGEAHKAFNSMPFQDVVSWCAIIAGYEQNGHSMEALKLFSQMQLAGVTPDSDIFASVLPACAHIGALQWGKEIHGCTIRNGFEIDDFVASGIIDMYAKCGKLYVAQLVFNKVAQKNIVSCNAMIVGYIQNGYWDESLNLFRQIQLTSMKPDAVTIASILSACAGLAALRRGKEIHDFIIRSGSECGVMVENGLIDMYAKCGDIELANQVFNKMSQRDVVSWNAMIAGYGMHGYGKEACTLFYLMQQVGIKPNHVTFVAVLSACSHAGLVDEGWQCFDCMSQEHHIIPSMEHYACMVDILGRAGHLDKAHDFIKKMPLEPDARVWGALFGACRIYCNVAIGKHVAEHLLELEPKNAGYYVLLSNIYAAVGRWDDMTTVRRMMKDRGFKKMPGCSWIEVNNTVHAFAAGDRSHPQSKEIYVKLETLIARMMAEGYVPDKTVVLHDVEDQEKQHILSSHSEKLAIAFGLISSHCGTPIFIIKNLRVCGDCHNATKFISKIVSREITIRDATRFHHFKGGLCSCGDYW